MKMKLERRNAYFCKNELLPEDAGVVDPDEQSKDEKTEIKRILSMMTGMDKSEYLRQLQCCDSM